MSNLDFNQLPTLPVASTRLDQQKFERIFNECLNLKDFKNQRFSTNLSGHGSVQHYRLRENQYILCAEVQGMAEAYDKMYDIRSRNQFFIENKFEFDGSDLWVNYQKKGDHLTLHTHEGLLSWVLWVKIPYEIKDELKTGPESSTSCFVFNYNDFDGRQRTSKVSVSKKDQGILMMFPSQLQHIVYPFYTSEEERISISGNIRYKNMIQ